MSDTWELLKEECMNCTACPLAPTRTNVVFGVGDPNSSVLFVGEGPGEKEDLAGEPFVGPAGQLLDRYLEAVGLERSKVYIANMVKCRPPANRDPADSEIDCCIDFLRRQTRLISPKIIVCLGRISACRMIDKDFKVTRQHGEWFKKGNFWMMGTYHPAALLRNPNQKPDALLDFISLREKMRELGVWTGEID